MEKKTEQLQEKVVTASYHSWLIGLIIFIMGGCGLAYEYTFSKIASDLLGNSVRQWAIVIAIMLFCMGVGAEIQRYIKQKNVISALLYSQLALALLGGFGPVLMLHTFTAFPYHFGLIHYGMISTIGILIGFEIPLITRINESYTQNIQNNLAQVLKMDYIGALAGALVWVFVLPKWFTLHEIAYILAFLSLFATLLCWYFFRQKSKHSAIFLSALFIVIVSLSYGMSQTNNWSLHAEQRLYRDRIIFSETTPYQHIVITQNQYARTRCYINGHIQFCSDDEHIYHEQLVHPALSINSHKKRVLILGGGDGLAVREVLKHPEVAEIVLVDLDPAMTSLASTHPLFTKLNQASLTEHRVKLAPSPVLKKGEPYTLQELGGIQTKQNLTRDQLPILHVINLDATRFIKHVQGSFDVIICDFPDPSSPGLAKLYSLNFYGSLKDKLSADGIIVQQSTSPFRAKEAFLCIGRTLKAANLTAIPYHDHVPSFGEWGWWIACHPSYAKEEELKKQLTKVEDLPDSVRYLTPDLIRSSLFFGKEDLLTTQTDITTLSDNAVMQHYLNGWLE